MRTAEDIDNGLENLFVDNKRKAIVSVCECEHHPLWTNTLPADLNMENFLRKEIANTNRQDLPTYFRLNGAIYIGYADYIKRNNGFWGRDTFAYIMPRERSVSYTHLTLPTN